MVGQNTGNILECYNKANVYGTSNLDAMIGGIAGNSHGTTSNCYNTGTINTTNSGRYVFIGGIVGGTYSKSTTNSYNCGNVSGSAAYIYIGGVVGSNGSGTTASGTISHCYCTTSTTYSYYTGSNWRWYADTTGRVDANTLKGYTDTLNNGTGNWVADTYSINNGYPILRWQISQLHLNKVQEYLNVGDTLQLTADKSRSQVSLGNISWNSMDTSIASVDNTGKVTGIGEGTTTIYATESTYSTKAMCVINVSKSGAVAFAQVVTGSDTSHTVVLKEDGTVWAVGDNRFGQLGDGTNINRTELVQVIKADGTALKGIVKITTGFKHLLALSKDGKVYAWGCGAEGAMGNNDTSDKNCATQVLDVNGVDYLSDIVDISSGYQNNMALSRDGTIYTWGDNRCGALGIGSTTSQSLPKFSLHGKAVKACLGGYESYIIRPDGGLSAAGRDTFIGINDRSGNLYTIPQSININDVVDVVASHANVLVKNIDGDVYCEGHNTCGEFGEGKTVGLYVIAFTKVVLPSAVTSTNKVKYFGINAINTYLLLQDGTIWTAGNNTYGQISNGSTSTSVATYIQAKDSNGNNITNAKNITKSMIASISGYPRQNLAYIDNDGYVYISGNNSSGQYGNGTTTNNVYYTKMGVPYLNYKDSSNIITIGVDESFNLDRNKFKIEEFNVSFDYEAKDTGTLNFSTEDSNITVNNNGKITGVEEGFAKVKVRDNTNNLETYIIVKVVNDKNMALEFGDKFTVGLTTSGQVWTWGSNINRELGIGSPGESAPINVDEPTRVTSLQNIIDIGAGLSHVVALDEDGDVYTWGLNRHGQLGDGGTTNLNEPTKITGLSNIVKVDAHKNYTTALDRNGSLYAWGEGYDLTPKVIASNVLDIDDGIIITKERRARRIDSETVIPGIRNAISVSGSNDRVLVLTADGILYNVENDGTLTTLSVANAVDVSAGNGYGYILNKNKDVYTFGSNTNGECGNGTNTEVAVPTKIDTLENIEIISAGEGATAGVADFAGYMFTTGLNEYGQLGHGDIDNKNVFETILNVALESSCDKIVEGIDDSEIVDIGLGITLNLKRDLEQDSTSEVSIVDNSIASLRKNVDGTYTVTGKSIGRTFLNATIIGIINGEEKQFATNVEVRIVPDGGITIPQIKSGADFSVALKATGELEAWGRNNYGQLGIGSTESYDEPYKLDGVDETIVEIACGDNHVLALTENGNIYGWGLNTSGQVGNGTIANQLEHATVINIYGNELSKIIRVEADEDNSFAINEDGEVFAWGRDFGNKAIKLTNLENVVDVSTNYFVKADGTAWKMGTLEKLVIVGKVRALDEGTDHAVFVTSEGGVWAVGKNDHGQLGLGNTAEKQAPVAMRKDASHLIDDAVAVEAGDRYTVVLTNTGDVYATGLNENGKLGIDVDTPNVLMPVKNSNISGGMLISAGEDHCVVAKTNGETFAWGKGTPGSLGNREMKDSVLPVMVGPYVIRTNERHIVLGKTDTFTLKAKTEYFNIIDEPKIPMTGISKDTQVARISTLPDSELTEDEVKAGYTAYNIEGIKDGTTNLILTESKTSSNGIVQVEVLPEANTKISPEVKTVANHTVTLKTNGTVWTYGNNEFGQLGTGNVRTYDEPQKVIFGQDENGDEVKIKQIAVGEYHSVALDTNGNVWTWGRNNYYQLGMNAVAYSSIPVKVTGIPKCTRIASANNSVMAVTEDNKLVAWGQNAYGELCNGTYTNKSLPNIIEGMHDVLDIGGGKNHYIALKTTGEIYAIGSNLYEQLGIDLGEKTRTKDFTKIDINAKIGAIAVGQSSNVAVSIDGKAFMWGQNTLGNLGAPYNNISEPTPITGAVGIVQADVGKTHTVLRDYNKEMYIIGQNKYGQIGNGTYNDVTTLTHLDNVSNALRMTAGNTYTVMMRADGSVWAWGDYNHGDKLLKSKTNSNVPIKIGSDTSSLDTFEIVIRKSEVHSILANSEFKFNLIYEDQNSTSDFRYESLNPTIATIDQYGNVLGVREGTTWVRLTDTKTDKVSVAMIRVVDNVAGYMIYAAPKIATGEDFVASLKENGNIDIWGYDDSYLADSDIPVSMNVVETYTDLKAGKHHILALRSDGTVWSAGDNSYGQLGRGTYNNSQKLVQVQDLTDIVKIAVGDNFSACMDSYGIIYVWGEGFSNLPVKLETDIRDGSYLAGGSKDQIAVVLPTNEIMGFGSILNGMLPGFTTAVKVEIDDNYLMIVDIYGDVYKYQNGSLSKVSEISRAVDISVDSGVYMYQNVNEKVYTWGDNSQGQLGTGTTIAQNHPVEPLEYNEDVFTISAGRNNTYIVDDYGYVYSAGDNRLGQIGNGTKEDTTADSYQKSVLHTLVGGREFEVKPVEAIMEVNDIEDLEIIGNSYNVFEEHNTKSPKEFNFTSANSNVVEVLEDDGLSNGKIKAIAEGTTTIDIADKVTEDKVTITRKVVPLDQNRIKTIIADGNEAEGNSPSDGAVYVFGYTVDVPMDDDQELVTLSITTKNNTDKISIDGGTTFADNGMFDQQITFTNKQMVIPVTIRTSNGTDFMYELILNRVSNNNKVDKVTVNGHEALRSLVEEDVYEIVINDLGDNLMKVTAEDENASVSIKGSAGAVGEQEYTANLVDGYLEVPFKITSEAGKANSALLKIYVPDRFLNLETLTVNAIDAELGADGKYSATIDDDLTRVKISAKANLNDAYVGINDIEKELTQTTKSVLVTDDITAVVVKLERQTIVDGVDTLITKDYDLNINKNRVFSFADSVTLNGDAIDEENNTYTGYVLSNVDSGNVVITAVDPDYKITFGEHEGRGTVSGDVSLPRDTNLFDFEIEDNSGNSKVYTLIINRGSVDTTVKKITVSDDEYVVEAEKTDETISDIEVYEAKILDTHIDVDVMALLANKNSFVEINNSGNLVKKTDTYSMSLTEKETIVPIKVTSADQATVKNYYLRILRVNDDTSLSSVSAKEIPVGTEIEGVVDAGDSRHYEIQLERAVNQVELTCVTSSESAEININDEGYVDGSSTVVLDIDSSVTEIEIKVRSESGTEVSYYVTINTISDETAIESITVDGENAIWNNVNNRYEIKVDRDKPSYTVVGTTVDEDASIAISGTSNKHQVTKSITNQLDETVVNIQVTAPNGITSDEKKLAIIEKSNNANLGYVKINGKGVTADDDGDYYAEVVSSTRAALIEVGAEEPNAIIDLDGDTMTGIWKGSKVLQTELENYVVDITAEDGVTAIEPFHIKIKRLDGNTDISELDVSYTKGGVAGTKSAEMIDESTYYVKIPRVEEDRVRLDITLAKDISTIYLPGADKKGGITKDVNLFGEITEVPIVVVAEDGTREDLILRIEKESTDTSLESLDACDGEVSLGDGGYTITVDSKQETVTISAEPTHENAKIKVSGKEYASTLVDEVVSIAGVDSFDLVIMAEDGETEETHTVQIARVYNAEVDTVTLEGVDAVLGGELNVVECDDDTAEMCVTAVNDDAMIYIYSGNNVLGTGSGSFTLDVDVAEETETTYTIVITGPDEYEEISETYTIAIRKKATVTSAVIKLDGSAMVLDEESGLYEASVVGASHTLSVECESAFASVSIDGTAGDSKALALEAGSTTTYEVVVTAENGGSQEYNVKIYRKNNNTDISAVSIKVGADGTDEALVALSDGTYYKKIPRDTEVCYVTLNAFDGNASAYIDETGEEGSSSVIGEVNIGASDEIKIVALKIVAEDGSENTVNLKIEKESNDATLKELKYDGNVISEVDSEFTLNVDYRLSEISICAVPTNAYATVSVDGSTFVPELIDAVVDIEDRDSFNITVKAEDGTTTKVYKVNITLVFNAKLEEITVDTDEEVTATGTAYKAFVSRNVATHEVCIKAEDALTAIKVYDSNAHEIASGTGEVTFNNGFDGETGMYSIELGPPADFAGEVVLYTLTLKKKSTDTSAKVYVNDTAVALDQASGKYKFMTRVSNNMVKVTTNSEYASVAFDGGASVVNTYEKVYVVNLEETKTVHVLVTAQNGETEEFDVEVTRPNNNSNISSIDVNGLVAKKITSEMYRNVQDKDERNARVSIYPEFRGSTVRAQVDGRSYENVGTLIFDMALSGNGTKEVAITVVAKDGTSQDYTLVVAQSSAEEMNLDVKVNNTSAEKVDDLSYRMFVSAGDTSANVDIIGDEYTHIVADKLSGSRVTFTKELSEVGDITLVLFTASDEFGHSGNFMLYIVKKSTDNSIKNLYVNDIELTKDESGRYTVFVENTDSDPTVRVKTKSDYAQVAIGSNEAVVHEASALISLGDDRTTQVPIVVTSQSGQAVTEYLDIVKMYTSGVIESVIIDDIEVTDYNPETRTFTALVESAIDKHEIVAMADNNYVTLEIEGDVGLGSVTTLAGFEPGEEIKAMTLYVTGETDLTEEYTIVIAKKSNNVELAQVKVNGEILTEGDNYVYKHYMLYSGDTVRVEATANYPYSTVKVGDDETKVGASGVVEVGIDVTEDVNTIPIVVTAADGQTTRTYNIVIMRARNLISGKIVTENKYGKHNAKVRVYASGSDEALEDREVLAEVETEDDGTFTVELTNVGTYDLYVMKPGYVL